MQNLASKMERRTNVDLIFEHLHEQIIHMRLLPGAKLSEAEIARQFNVSRQPVRDALSRLSNLDLVLIRPQRATEVRSLSMASINETRFLRRAVECEVLRRACEIWDDERDHALEESLAEQRLAIADEATDEFHSLDTAFHQLVCTLAHCPEALATIAECRQKINRLCMLELSQPSEVHELLADHQRLAAALRRRALDDAIAVSNFHLSRLDETVNDIHQKNRQYFEDDDQT